MIVRHGIEVSDDHPNAKNFTPYYLTPMNNDYELH